MNPVDRVKLLASQLREALESPDCEGMLEALLDPEQSDCLISALEALAPPGVTSS